MFYNMYEGVHNSLGLHFWDLPTLVVAVLLIVVLVVHSRNQKKREDELNDARDEKLQTIQKEASGESAGA